MPKPLLLVFTKPARMGLSKTRLAKDIGLTQSWRVNRYLLSHTMSQILDRRWQTKLFIAPNRALHQSLGLSVSTLAPPRRPQGQGDLGQKLTRAFRLANMGPVVVIGTDMPNLTKSLIWRAFCALKYKNAVIGPSKDGGFYLFGQIKTSGWQSPFSGIRWSTSQTLSDLEANLDGYILNYLPEFNDIDDGESLKMQHIIR